MPLLQRRSPVETPETQIQAILKTVLAYQLDNGLVPYAWGPQFQTGGDYAWAHWMIALMYAERTGHLPMDEAAQRIGRLLAAVDRLPKYRGWLYKGYDLKSLEPVCQGYGFQPFYMMSLILAAKIYPSLRSLAQKLLFAYDYSKSYDPRDRTLADYNTEKAAREHPIPMEGPQGMPGSERRLAYVVYSYLTGDLAPWLLQEAPNFQEIGGRRFLAVSKGFNFDICHMHLMLPEIGYYERPWGNFLDGSEEHMECEGLDLFPIRSGPHEDGLSEFSTPNIEHHQSMPYLTWYWKPELPLLEQAFVPGLGFLRLNDHWRYYWSYGARLRPADDACGLIQLHFPQCFDPVYPDAARIQKLRVYAGARNPGAKVDVVFNGRRAGQFSPHRESCWHEVELDFPVDRINEIQLVANPEDSVIFHRYEKSVAGAVSQGKRIEGIAAEVLCEGPYVHTPGSENSENAIVEDTCTALSVRISSHHEYYLWHELLDDPRFTGTLVNWAGEYHHAASIGEVIYNVSDSPVTVEYARKPEW